MRARLSGEDVRGIVERFRAGVPKHRLAGGVRHEPQHDEAGAESLKTRRAPGARPTAFR